MCAITAPRQEAEISLSTIDPPELVPGDDLSRAAYTLVKTHLHPSILAHSMHVFFYALKHSQISSYDCPNHVAWHEGKHLPLLFTACMFHDFGASAACDDRPWRFEVEGADAAVAFLKTHGIADADAHAVWVAIACHTSAHIGERISPLARLVRLGPLSDFHRLSKGSIQVVDDPTQGDGKRSWILTQDVQYIEELYPRSSIENVLADSIIAQARRPGYDGKAPPSTWPGAILQSANQHPGWTGINKAF